MPNSSPLPCSLTGWAVLAGLGIAPPGGCTSQAQAAPTATGSDHAALPIEAPFILTNEEARWFDGRLDEAPCEFEKAGLSRYYWFDFVSAPGGYRIDQSLIRFILKDDGARSVQAVAQMPGPVVMDGEDGRTVAVGEISNPEGRLERLDCRQKGPSGKGG